MKINPAGAESLNKGSLEYAQHVMQNSVNKSGKDEPQKTAPDKMNELDQKGFKIDTKA